MRPQLSSNAVVDVVDTFVVLFVHGQYLTDQEGGGQKHAPRLHIPNMELLR